MHDQQIIRTGHHCDATTVHDPHIVDQGSGSSGWCSGEPADTQPAEQPQPVAVHAEGDCCYRLRATKAVLADRERELLDLKGPCSSDRCRLHHAHAGPCDIAEEAGDR